MRPLEVRLSQLNDGVRWYSDNPNIQVFISFTVKITASHLKKIRYSHYQQELSEIIKKKHVSGMGYRMKSDMRWECIGNGGVPIGNKCMK